jgi:hypothetical protein
LKLQKKDDEIRQLEEILERLFTSAQIKLLKGNNCNKYVHYEEQDLSKAVAIHSISSRAYTYLRDQLKFPLPSINTVYRWLRKIPVQPGKLILPVMQILRMQFINAKPMNRVCVLALDEMTINDEYCYDMKEDIILGGMKEACVITVRGLFSGWKQILHFDWEKYPTKEDIISIISALHNINLEVRAITSDMGTRNQGLWKEFGVGKVVRGELEKTYFSHPITGAKIWVFADFPHLLKLLRNHTLDDGITLRDGAVINKKTFLDFIQTQQKEYALAPTITHRHVHCTGRQRQNVATAFQLFSNKVAKAIPILMPGNVIQANFIRIVNDFSDLMNSRSKDLKSNVNLCAYGMDLMEQNKTLDIAYQEFSSMVVGTRKSYCPFQKGLLMDIISLRGLFSDLSVERGALYIMTARLNQDYLENLFSQIRSLGGQNRNPTALDFKYRIKKVICCRSLVTPGTTSVKSDTDAVMLSEKIFSEMCNDNIDMEDLSTRQAAAPRLDEIRLERLTDLDWNVTPHATAMEDLRYNERCEEGGKEYVAGYIAAHFLQDHPELSRIGAQEERSGFWVQYLSDKEQGLCEPSTLWMALFRKFEDIFRIFHGDKSCSKLPGVVAHLKQILTDNYQDVPVDVIAYYSKFRILLRVRYLNKLLEDQKFLKQERSREFYRNKCKADCSERMDEGVAVSAERISEEIATHERDLEVVESLISAYSQPSIY